MPVIQSNGGCFRPNWSSYGQWAGIYFILVQFNLSMNFFAWFKVWLKYLLDNVLQILLKISANFIAPNFPLVLVLILVIFFLYYSLCTQQCLICSLIKFNLQEKFLVFLQIGIIDPDCRLIGLHLYDGLFKVFDTITCNAYI